MKRSLFYLFIIAGIAGLLYFFSEQEDGIQPVELGEHGKISSLSLVNQKGEPFNLENMRDKILVINFFFTSCQGPCPIMSQKMAELQESFVNASEVNLISITVDPDTDSPEVLLQYAENYHALPDKWSFLTGDEANIVAFAQDQLKVGMGEHADLHSTKLILIDQKMTIRGYYDSHNDKDMTKLKKDVQRLRHNPPLS
ncbi:MAG: SCO family protein [Deltaproteobacteria bacterium]|nr:SCO family protein [Deltaproteobacteria bacterium]